MFRVLLSPASGSVFGDKSVFNAIGSKGCKIADGNIVTIGNEEGRPWQPFTFKSKPCHQSSVVPYLARLFDSAKYLKPWIGVGFT